MHKSLFLSIASACLAAVTAVDIAAGEWKAKPGPLMTPWGEKVTPENAWTEYPRPQMARKNWTNLNGLWDYAIINTKDGKSQPGQWTGKILVPYPVESRLSGVKQLLHPHQYLWYRRTVEVDKKEGKRYLLHFEAVDYDTTVMVNGKKAGRHVGGNTPFKFDITDLLEPGENEISLRVFDITGGYQLRGKQVRKPGGIRYTRVSGIWQPAWMEEVPAGYIDRLKIDTAIDPATIKVQVFPGGKGGEKISVTASFDGKTVAKAEGSLDGVELKIEDAKLWSTESPNLYPLKVDLLDSGGDIIDSVDSYAGIRTVGKKRDADGHLRFTLNGKMIFHWGPLDQGWWPDGLLTPPSDEAMLSDIRFILDSGFNMVRNHIKVKHRRYYYHCDRLGLMVWQDHVSGGPGPGWTRLQPAPTRKSRTWPKEHHDQFMYELREMIDYLFNSPSIVSWVPFNEAWGQHQSMEVGQWTCKYDPTRLVNIASGGNFWSVGDIADGHSYPDPGFPLGDKRFNDYIKVVGEFGGLGLVVDKKHLWDPNNRNWGYGGLKNADGYKRDFKGVIMKLNKMRPNGIAGAVYTQTTDVEGEVNGLMTYDRKVKKIPPKELKEITKVLFLPPPKITVILPTSEREGAEWKYNTNKPSDDWFRPDFDDSSWKTGKAGFGDGGRTKWKTSDIWIRRQFELKEEVEVDELMISIRHDDNAVVYINGEKAAVVADWSPTYEMVPAKNLLKKGKNTIAIYCHQDTGGQFIDAGLAGLKYPEKKEK